MLGELSVGIDSAKEHLRDLYEERKMFILLNEEELDEAEYMAGLKEIDDRIDRAEEELYGLEQEYEEVLAEHSDWNEREPMPDEFEEEFDELAQVDGISPQEEIDGIATLDELIEAERKARDE